MSRHTYGCNLQSKPKPRDVRLPPARIGRKERERIAAEEAARAAAFETEPEPEPKPDTLPLRVRKPKKGWHTHHGRVLTCTNQTDCLGRVMAMDSTGQMFWVDPNRGHDVQSVESLHYPQLIYDSTRPYSLANRDQILEVGMRGDAIKRFVTLPDYHAPAPAN